MTPNEIIESNTLIAEFMDLKEGFPVETDGYGYHQVLEGFTTTHINPYSHAEAHNDYDWPIKDLRYHSSWDWLMPVIEKISCHEYERHEQEQDVLGTHPTIVIVTAYPRTFGMPTQDNRFMFRYNCCGLFISDTLIEAAWQATLDFVKSAKALGNG